MAALAAALVATSHLLQRHVFEGDAMTHQYWMRSFADPGLFADPLTASLRESARYPEGYEALFRLVAAAGADPVIFGEWLGVGLMAAAGWLVFAIVREHTPWRPAAWIGAALFLALDGHRFYGGFPRAFVHVIVLCTVLLAIRRREAAAAVVAGAGAALYPPCWALAAGVLIVRAVRWGPRRTAAAAFALGLAVVLAERLVAGGGTDVLTAAEARRYPDFGERGGLHFFVSSTLDYVRQNRSGFDLRATGSLLLLALLGLLAMRPAEIRRLRPEVLALPVVAVGGYVLAQATLFRMYLPHRYTYPLLAFLAVAVAVLLRPVWDAAATRTRFAVLAAPVPLAFAAHHLFPLGPMRPVDGMAWLVALAVATGVAAIATWRLPAAGALLTGLVLVAATLGTPGRRPPGQACHVTQAVEFLAGLPKDAIVAGDPIDLKCLPVTARRAVVISTQLAPSYERGYFLEGRARMFAMLDAYYGPSAEPLTALHDRYGATHLWVRRGAIRRELRAPDRWRARRLPYGAMVRRLLAGGEPATLRLPDRCRRWSGGGEAVYDLRCLR